MPHTKSDMSWLASRSLGPNCPESEVVQLFTAWRKGLQEGKLSLGCVGAQLVCPAWEGTKMCPSLAAPVAFCDILAFMYNRCLRILLQVWAFDSISFPSEFFLTANLLINACLSIQTVNTMQSALSQTVLTLTPVDERPIHLLNQVSTACFLSFKWKCWRDNSIFGNRNWQWWKLFFLLALTYSSYNS